MGLEESGFQRHCGSRKSFLELLWKRNGHSGATGKTGGTHSRKSWQDLEGGTGEAGMYSGPGEGFPHNLLLRLFVGPYTSMCVDTQTQLGMAGAGMRMERGEERSLASPGCKNATLLLR